MANVLTRRICRNILKIRRITNSAKNSYATIILTKFHNNDTYFYNTDIFKGSLLHLSKNHYNFKCYSTDPKKDTKELSGNKSEEKEEVKLSLFQKFKQMYRDYWYVLVPVHVVTSAFWFGTFYYMAKSGIDVVAVLESMHVSEKFTNHLKDSSMGYIAVAYALYKITTPVRYTVTLGGTTISINYLKKWGYIKPVPSKERMKEIYLEKKGTLTKSMKETREGIMETKENLMETVRETKEGIIEKKDNIMDSLQDKKEGLKDKKEHIVGTVKETKDILKKRKESIKEKVSSVKGKTKL